MREELLRVAGRVVDQAGAIDLQCEAFVQKQRSTAVLVEGGRITFASQDGDYGIGIRVISGRHTGYAFCDESSIGFGLKQALAVARHSKPGSYALPGEAKYDGTRSIFDNNIATMVAEDGIQLANDLVEGASFDPRAVPSRGGLSFAVNSYAVANTNGVSIFDEGTIIGGHVMSLLREDGVTVNGDESRVSRTRDFSFEEIGRRATEKAIGQLGQRAVETASMDVIMRPEAAFSVIAGTVMPALYGEAVRKGESVYADRMGQQVAPGCISIVDDATFPRGLNTYIADEEGYPSQRTVLVGQGILTALLYDKYSSLEAHARPTGNAMHAERFETGTTYKAPPTTCARNFILEGETMGEEEMIRGIRRGVIVDNVLGAHTANKASGDFSVAIYAGHYIQDGEIAYPLKGGMIGGNMPEMLLRASLADNYKLVDAGTSPASGFIPSIKFENVRISGG